MNAPDRIAAGAVARRTHGERTAMPKLSVVAALVVSLALTLVASGCGGGGAGSTTVTLNRSVGGSGPAKRGGELTVLSVEDVTSLDPGYWYYTYDYQALAGPTQRQLYGWKPSDTTPSPDLAASMPQTSPDGKTVTIKIKPDIRYSPPLQTRTVKSADVKYALERTFMTSVHNAYSPFYYNAIVGSAAFRAHKATSISGLQTPDDTTLVIKLSHPVGVISNGQALALPGTIPVPQDYASKYDEHDPSTYGMHQVFTGPYMIANDGKGTITGYKTNRIISLVRNPSWDPKTDYRPAYLDKITLLGGNDIDVASRRILSGKSFASGDFAAPPVNILRSALSTRRDQLAIVPSQGNRFITLNTTVKPFDNVDVRRAAAAVIDRNTLRLTRGGPTLGPIATHFLPPEISGFAQAGGLKGTLAFMKNPNGDLALARSYMRKAGYPSGRYSGPPLLMVGDDQRPASTTAQAVRSQLEKLGFKFEYRQLSRTTTFSTTCGDPKAKVAVCPNGGWGKDFFDPQSLLDPVFNGEGLGVGSPDWSQVNDPELNADLDIAAAETDPVKRARDYAEIDRTVTSRAYVIPWLWDNQINSVSDNVRGVVNKFTVSWDLSYMSLK
jgi:peptide/nickel transport system substrate-binding protein